MLRIPANAPLCPEAGGAGIYIDWCIRVRLNYTFFELNSLYTALATRIAGNNFSINLL